MRKPICSIFAVALALFAVQAFAQQSQPATPTEVVNALTMKLQGLQQSLDMAYLQIARDSAATEAQKATLIEWLQEAQKSAQNGKK
jgi:outer membrane lipoprotein-sorting protein